jgi:hypothetical protein
MFGRTRYITNEYVKMKQLRTLVAVLIFSLFATKAISQDDLNLNPLLGKIDSSNIFIDKDYYTWCSSVIKGEDGKYHMFYSRWPHGKRKLDDDSMNYIFNGFAGWMKYSEIAYAVSDKLNGPYHYVSTVIKSDGDPKKWDRFTMHNPHIRKFGNEYYLYYISSSYDSSYTNPKFKKEQLKWYQYNCGQKIGVLKAKHIEDFGNGKYTKAPSWLVAVDNVSTFEVVNNPSVTEGPDGKYYMIYKSRIPGANMTFWMAKANKPDEPFTTIGKVFTETEMACEDPSMWYDKKRGRFYVVAKYYSNSKKLAPQFGALVLLTSKDGSHWEAATHTLVSLRELNFKDGRKVELDRLERPFIVTDKNGNPITLFAAASVKSPGAGDLNNLLPEYNSFNVAIPINHP